MSIESIISETEEFIYAKFETVCINSKSNDIETVTTFNIDVNREDGYFTGVIALRNDIELLQLFLRFGANVHLNNEGILGSCACCGYLEIVTFLIEECECDYKVLYGTTAYSNSTRIKQYIDSLSSI